MLTRGSLFWADLNPTRGREQSGRRPVLVVASRLFLLPADTLAIIVPITTTDRGWPNHVRITGRDVTLPQQSFAMTEQIRTVARERLHTEAGIADAETMNQVDVWLSDFLGLH
ncbi:MAG: type II toxin-antitoxin system PemK/MazF family toxin [Galactobacter sp.]